jgi:hypothetical protein
MRTGIGVLIAIAAVTFGAASLAWLAPNSFIGAAIRDLIFERAPGDTNLFVSCGQPGQSCCKRRSSLPGFDPRYCDVGAGCDIATNTCVSPCGGGGQACCDGPDTYAPQGNESPTSPFFCRGTDCFPRKQMCAAGACTRETRRCNEQCGKTAGAACCPPDAGIAVASCKTADLVCEFGAQSSQSGTCMRCGEQGQPPCAGGECRVSAGVRTVERNGICIACGYVGLPKCASGRRCDAGATPDPKGPNCIPGGGQDQPCLEGKFCGYDGMFCDNSNICRVCGAPGQPCCPNQPLLGGGFTKECGGYSNLQCANFNGRRVCQYKPGQAPGQQPPPPPPPNEPKTCGGQPYQIGVTTTFPVWARAFTGCAFIGAAYQANSFDEAVQCARTVYGDTVITDNVEQYTYSMDGPLGCRTVQVYAKDEEDASSCAQAQCINCDEPMPGTCP